MTVLAFLEDLGVAFSDVMLSIDKPGEHIVLPTVGHTAHVPQSLTLSPTRLVRKFFRLESPGNSGMFLIAGTVAHLERLILNLTLLRAGNITISASSERTFNAKDPASLVDTACKITEEQGFRDFEILGVIEGQMFVRTYDAHQFSEALPYYGKIHVAGSGGRDLYKWIEERGVFYANTPLVDESIDEKVIRSVNSIPMMLLGEDSLTRAKTITNGVGGYYESYLFDNKNLHPVDNVLTVMAKVCGKGSTPSIEIERIYYHKYVDDWLLVVSLFDTPLLISPTVPLKIPLKQFELFKIPPIFNKRKEPNWTVSRLVGSMVVAGAFRLTLSRDEPLPIHKRFSEGSSPSRRLFAMQIAGENLSVSINHESLTYFISRFKSGASNEAVLSLRH